MSVRVVQYQQHVRVIPPVAAPTGWDVAQPIVKFRPFIDRSRGEWPPESLATVITFYPDGYEAIIPDRFPSRPAKPPTPSDVIVPAALVGMAWIDSAVLRRVLRPIISLPEFPAQLVPTAFVGNAWMSMWDGPQRKPYPVGAQQDHDLAVQQVPTPFVGNDWPDYPVLVKSPRAVPFTDLPPEQPAPIFLAWPAFPERFIGPRAKPFADLPVRQVPTVFVPDAWVSYWDPVHKPFPAAEQRDNDPVLGAYSAVVVVSPNGWQSISFEPLRRSKVAPSLATEPASSPAASTIWSDVYPVAHIHWTFTSRGGDDFPGSTAVGASIPWNAPEPALRAPARQKSSAIELPLFSTVSAGATADYGWYSVLVGRRHVAAPSAAVDPASSPAFAQMGWGTQYPDGLPRHRALPAPDLFAPKAIGASPTGWNDVVGQPTARPRKAAGGQDAVPQQRIQQTLAPAELWSVDSYHLRTIRGFPEYSFIGIARLGKIIVARPTLLGTDQRPTMLGTDAQAALGGVKAQASLSGTKTTPTLLGADDEPDLEGDVENGRGS